VRDWYAAFPLYTREQLFTLKTASPVPDAASLIDLLAQTIASEDTKTLGLEMYTSFLKAPTYRKNLEVGSELIEALRLGPPPHIELSVLPRLSFFVRADFTLDTPYLSRDDRIFSVTENPVRKEWVFGLPLLASTTWKGVLRNACMLQAPDAVDRLFGPEPPENEEKRETRETLHEGRVCAFPTFFSQIASEIINPHDRRRRIGKNPIRIECVPKGASGRFTLLYLAIPRDAASKELSERQFREQVAGDLVTVTSCVRAAMRDYGFSAKKSSGYGTAADGLRGERGLIEVGGFDEGRATFSKFSEIGSAAELLATKIRGSM
jgi:CRISPR-associated protein Cmr2